MTYFCKLFDLSIMEKSKHKHLKSIGHKILDDSIITRYNIQDPNIDDTDEIMRKFVNIYKKIWAIFG